MQIFEINWLLITTIGGALVLGPAAFFAFPKERSGENNNTESAGPCAKHTKVPSALCRNTLDHCITDRTSEGFWITSLDGTAVDVNPALCNMLGYSAGEILGKTLCDFADKKNSIMIKHHQSLFVSGENHIYETTLKTKNGGDLHVRVNATSIMATSKTEDKQPSMIMAFISDISERKLHEDELYHQAHYDSTTGLPNRHFLIKHINALMNTNESFGIILIGMDNFKNYNDTYGHTYGDLLLTEISKRLKKNLSDRDFLARIGGDEFVVVSRQHQEAVNTTANKLLHVLSDHPIITEAREIYTTASIGISYSPDNGRELDQLLRSADLAMTHVKRTCKGQKRAYCKLLDHDLREKLELGNRLRKALQNNEFSVEYQPQISLDTMRTEGVEALLRWNNPELGSVPPDKFIPVLEDLGLIVEVGEWVLRTACTQLNCHAVRLSVNLSARQFIEAGLVESVGQILAETKYPGNRLILEITESLLIGDVTQVTKQLNAITSTGVSFSIDDFGTGYSSLSYLQKLPIKEVKIDKVFIRNLTNNNGDLAIVKTIIAMASSLSMETVAEGVENEIQLHKLKEIGAGMVQGYFTGKPLTYEKLTSYLFENNKELARQNIDKIYATHPELKTAS